MTIVSIVAVLLSPVIAVVVSIFLQDRREKRNQKLWIFNTLMATRHTVVLEEKVRALNMIEVAFYDCPRVRQLWREYFNMLCNDGLNNDNGWDQRRTKNLEMVTEMAKALGYAKAITHIDVERVYSPVGLAQQSSRNEEMMNELLRVLKESKGMQFVPQPAPEKQDRKK